MWHGFFNKLLERRGKKKWRHHVADVVARLIAALEPDDVVLGGGNVKELEDLPHGCRRGNNANAFLGGFRLWEDASKSRSTEDGRRKEHKRGDTGGSSYQKSGHSTANQAYGLEGSPSPL
jgi:predicted NBD/HSP70 family sugar kinase